MQTKSGQILPPWLQLDFWLLILEFHSSVSPCASLAEKHFSSRWGQPALLASIAPGKTRALSVSLNLTQYQSQADPWLQNLLEDQSKFWRIESFKEIVLLIELCAAACHFTSQLLLWQFLPSWLQFATWWNMTLMTEEEGLHLNFLTYFTSLSPVWLCWCLAISCMNASFYPNHSPEFFPGAFRPGFKAGWATFLFCCKITYCTKSELVLVSTSVHMGFVNKREKLQPGPGKREGSGVT